MAFVLALFTVLLLQCGLCSAGFCSDDELAGECFEDKIKPMAIGAASVAFVLGISTILLAIALLCKAKQRKRAKVMVYRRPNGAVRNGKLEIVKGARNNRGFQTASQYYVKRPDDMYDVRPQYVTSKPMKEVKEVTHMAGSETRMMSGDEKKGGSSPGMLSWVPSKA